MLLVDYLPLIVKKIKEMRAVCPFLVMQKQRLKIYFAGHLLVRQI